ncbi:hypothetical protein L7F22_025190, partial [Adiantum nelumboides]|nr:hypothetical protein [Adiantum nelumboides]
MKSGSVYSRQSAAFMRCAGVVLELVVNTAAFAASVKFGASMTQEGWVALVFKSLGAEFSGGSKLSLSHKGWVVVLFTSSFQVCFTE